MSGDEARLALDEQIAEVKAIQEKERVERLEKQAENSLEVRLAIKLFDLFHRFTDPFEPWDLFEKETSWVDFPPTSTRPFWLKRSRTLLIEYDGDYEAALKAAETIFAFVLDSSKEAKWR